MEAMFHNPFEATRGHQSSESCGTVTVTEADGGDEERDGSNGDDSGPDLPDAPELPNIPDNLVPGVDNTVAIGGAAALVVIILLLAVSS